MSSVWDQFSDPVAASPAESWDSFSDPVRKPRVTRQELMRRQPEEYDPSSPQYQEKYGATSSMGGGQRFLAGAGKAFVDIGRGIRQAAAEGLDMITPGEGTRGEALRVQQDERRALDAPLMASGAAKAGNIVGGVAAAAPAMLIPGANTVVGAGLVGATYGALQPVGTNDSRTMNAAVGGATGAAAQYLGGKVSQWAGKKIQQRAANAATEKAQNAVRDATLREAQKAGYVVPPSTTNQSIANRAVESIAGKAQTAQVAAVKNQQVTNRLAREALGLPKDAPLTRGTLNAVRTKAGAVYKAIEAAGDIAADGQYVDDLAAIAQSMDDVARDFPDLNLNNNKEISSLVDGLLRDKFSAKSAVELTKQLRKSASGNLSGVNAADPAKRALGYAQRDAAAAVEDQLIRHLQSTGKGSLSKAFDESRRLIAKTYSVESALNEGTGNIVARNLGGQLKKGKPLSGELETIAKFAQSFGRAAQEITDSPGVSALDAMFGVAGGVSLNPALVAMPVGRNVVRSSITAPAVNRFMGSPSYTPGRVGTGVLKSARQIGRRAALPSAVYAAQE